MAASDGYDLDAYLRPARDAAARKAKYKKFKLFDRTWRVTTQPNAFAQMAMATGDVEAIVVQLTNMVHPSERQEFHATLLREDDVDEDVLLKMLEGLYEAATDRPTKSRSGSAGRSRKKAASRK